MSDTTTAPGQWNSHAEVDATGHPSPTTRLPPELPRPWVPSDIVRAYDRASASGREQDWERFVEDVWARRDRLRADECKWLLEACGRTVTFRAKEALLRIAFALGEVGKAPLAIVERLLREALREESAELRLVALEVLIELFPERLVNYAHLGSDPHPAVRRAYDLALG